MSSEEMVDRTALAPSQHIDLRRGDRHLDLRYSERDIRESLQSAREVLEKHLLGDEMLHDGTTVRHVFYELTDIAIQALGEARARRA